MELQAWVKGQPLPVGHPGHGVFAYPQSATSPDVWMLGSSDYGAQLAAHLGLPYAFAWFITDGQGAPQALQIYRQSFKPSASLSKPHATLCVWALAADTDGIDGIEDNAGALLRPDSLPRAEAMGLKLDTHLQRNDAYTYFSALGDLVVTGPTHTNVNDFRAILIL
jgi:alkanesulfonate monooxygenase SsuD/methylene tetrahydromethanopterin reductase-like flavin-dependent oxidoreductase (luciferase family)